MKYKLYERDRNSQFQLGAGLFTHCDLFGTFKYIEEDEATAIRLKYPNAHMFPVKDQHHDILPSAE
jgi:hypothetical protein